MTLKELLKKCDSDCPISLTYIEEEKAGNLLTVLEDRVLNAEVYHINADMYTVLYIQAQHNAAKDKKIE